MTTTFAVVGIHGYGAHHLAELSAMAAEGSATLVAVADPRGADGVQHLPEGTPVHPDLESLLAAGVPDVVVLATPIQTHLPLATLALRAGAAVLLEKPTTASMAEFTQLGEVAAQTGRPVQVGFQSFGSDALDRIAEYVRAGAIGEVTGIGGVWTAWTWSMVWSPTRLRTPWRPPCVSTPRAAPRTCRRWRWTCSG